MNVLAGLTLAADVVADSSAIGTVLFGGALLAGGLGAGYLLFGRNAEEEDLELDGTSRDPEKPSLLDVFQVNKETALRDIDVQTLVLSKYLACLPPEILEDAHARSLASAEKQPTTPTAPTAPAAALSAAQEKALRKSGK